MASDDDRSDKSGRRAQPTEVVGGDGRSTEVLHSSRALPLDAGMPPSPSSAGKPAPPKAERTEPLDARKHAEPRKKKQSSTEPRARSRAAKPLPPEPPAKEPRPTTRELDDEAVGFEDPNATVALPAAYRTGGESSYLRPLTAHVRMHDESGEDPLRPRTEQRALAEGRSAPSYREHRPPPAAAPAPPPAQPEPYPATAERPPAPPTPPPPASHTPYAAPGYAPAPPPAYDDEPVPKVNIKAKQRRRSREVKTSRVRTGAVLLLVLFGFLALIGSAAKKMLLDDKPSDEVTLEAEAAWAPEPEVPAAWAPEEEPPPEADDEEGELPADIVRPDDEPGAEPEAAPEKAARRDARPKRRAAGAKRGRVRVAVLGVQDNSGAAGASRAVAKKELLRALERAGVDVGKRSRSRFGATVVVERVRKKRKSDSLLIEVKCRAAVRALPGDELKMSSTAEAAASMAGAADAEDERELVDTALAACTSKLGKDVAKFAHGR